MNKTNIRTNLKNATLEEREKLINNLVEAHKILYASIIKRTWKKTISKL